MSIVTSKDGTKIDIEVTGSGAPVILVTGALVDRQLHNPLAAVLAKNFTVYNYDRRGRGASTDVQPYAVEREIEDINAVISATGGSSFLFGASSGAALALKAAAAGLNVTKLALWEPPFMLKGSRPLPPADASKTLREIVADFRRGDALAYFMTEVVGMPAEVVADARTKPEWAAQEAQAHTLAYDSDIMGDYSIPMDQAAAVKAETLVLAGGKDMPWIVDTAKELAKHIPGAKFRHLVGQGHSVDPDVAGQALTEFFKD